jgi:hypothetical protein
MYVLSTYQVRVQHVHRPRLYVFSTYRGCRMSAFDNLFATGTATVISVEGKYVRVKCCHCDCQHAHPRDRRGSRAVLAACSTPHHPRVYAIPEAPKGNK